MVCSRSFRSFSTNWVDSGSKERRNGVRREEGGEEGGEGEESVMMW